MSKCGEAVPIKSESISHWGLVGKKPEFKDVECPYARKVAERVAQRAHEGMKKYGCTMERKDIDAKGWIDHAIEEALDFAVYLTRLKDDLK